MALKGLRVRHEKNTEFSKTSLPAKICQNYSAFSIIAFSKLIALIKENDCISCVEKWNNDSNNNKKIQVIY